MFSAFAKTASEKSINERVDVLLERMSLSQKLGQMMQVERSTVTYADIKAHHIGSVLSAAGSLPEDNSPRGWATMVESYWPTQQEMTQELSIPILYGVDAIHGHAHVKGATVFPHNIGLGAAHSDRLNAKIAQATAKEVLATGINWIFGPNIGVAQDFHWGRVYESYSQDSKLVGKFAKSYINSLQRPVEKQMVIACMKHWVGDGGTLYGIDQGETSLPYEELYQHHILPFVKGIKAGALTLMVSFSSWNRTKCHGSDFLINEILKGKLKFNGFVISDMEGIDYLDDSSYRSVATAVNAGIDMFMAPNNWLQLIDHLRNHIELGTVSMHRINDAVRRILYVKAKSGLLDSPLPTERKQTDSEDFACTKHKKLARIAVQKSLVLLKHDPSLLPLSKSVGVFVAGKSADNIGHQCGGFTIDWQGVSGNELFPNGQSIWQGIKSACKNARLSQSATGEDADPKREQVAIVVIGETPYAEGLGDLRINDNKIVETGSMIDGSFNVLEPYGNSLQLAKLHPEDLALIINLKNKGMKVVTVLVSGRPLIVNEELALSNTFVAAWLPGTAGEGVADVLFGDDNFHGKLPFTWPKEVVFKDRQASYFTPLFAQGFGLKY